MRVQSCAQVLSNQADLMGSELRLVIIGSHTAYNRIRSPQSLLLSGTL